MEKTVVQITPGRVLEEIVGIKGLRYLSGPDYIVMLLHSVMKINQFVLVGLSEFENFAENNEIPQEWNLSQDSWSFRYKHAKSPNSFVLKVLKLGSKLMIHAMTIENENQIWNFEILASNHLNPEFTDFGNASPFDVLKNVDQLIDSFNLHISSKILTETDFKKNVTKEKEKVPVTSLREDPFYDPLRIGRPQGGRQFRDPRIGIGHEDLYGVGGGFGNIPGFGGPGGGNVVGPNHPMFQGGGPRGGFGYPGTHPFPARYDPFGPVGPDFGSHGPKPDHFRPPDWGDDMYG